MKVWVLMGNDFPSGVYSSEAGGLAAIKVAKQEYAKLGVTAHIYWRLSEFEVDA